jgi:hypothetical protein
MSGNAAAWFFQTSADRMIVAMAMAKTAVIKTPFIVKVT